MNLPDQQPENVAQNVTMPITTNHSVMSSQVLQSPWYLSPSPSPSDRDQNLVEIQIKERDAFVDIFEMYAGNLRLESEF